jgi:ER membrane protein complex subunit 7
MALLGLFFIAQSEAHLIQGQIDNKGARALDYPSTRVVLNGGEYTGFVDNAGSFKIWVEKAGIYKLDVHNTLYHFEPVVVEVTDPQAIEDESGNKRMTKPKITPYLYSLKQGKGVRLVYPLQLEPSMKIQYFEIE